MQSEKMCSELEGRQDFVGVMEAAEYPAGVRISQMKATGAYLFSS